MSVVKIHNSIYATQIDLFAINGDACILVEVKSKLSVDDVNEHLERDGKGLNNCSQNIPINRLMVQSLRWSFLTHVAKYAYHKGFFVLAQQGGNCRNFE
ncbi:MAG: hypothetical protein R3E08_10620 [Thiotrichaceae bacterium]